MRQLEPQEFVQVEVDPRPHFHPSGVEITPGATYEFRARGMWQDGRWLACGPQGWCLPVINRWNRLPGKPFFLLCGAVGEDLGQAFAIGETLKRWVAPDNCEGRQLYLFANDWPSRYSNNRPLTEKEGGPLSLTIRRLSE